MSVTSLAVYMLFCCIICSVLRKNSRAHDEIRPVKIIRGWNIYAEGSALIAFGNTRVLCNATFQRGVPPFLRGQRSGWITAEYAMLPRSGTERSDRESVKGKISGRSHEISRLIGRSMRAILDRYALEENTIILDCDVLQADGGTRTAAITGSYIALYDALVWAKNQKILSKHPLTDSVSAVSVGLVGDQIFLDLDYSEDSNAQADINLVFTGSGKLVEIQGTAEKSPFSYGQFEQMMELAKTGCQALKEIQAASLD
ncbi:ribonuclease PH [Tropheryma whipplei str. Twist]|nr:ribonuclease PH [Tropheryma whipplei str. Twist]CAD67303.1 ribonuclease PH [Tropheryma whipplei TW08/27]